MDGETRVFEAAAICLYLADKYPEARLAPAIGTPERGRYLSLMVYSTSQLEPAMGDAGTRRRALSVRRLVHRRRRDDRFHVPLAAHVGWPDWPAPA